MAGKLARKFVPAPPGRPTLYKREYCQIVEDLGRQGKSPAQIASILNVAKITLVRWGQEHEEFGSALARAKTHEQAFWEQLGKDALNRKHFQSQVWRMSMAARFRDEYTEGKGVEVHLNLADLVKEALDTGAKQVEAHVDLPMIPNKRS